MVIALDPWRPDCKSAQQLFYNLSLEKGKTFEIQRSCYGADMGGGENYRLEENQFFQLSPPCLYSLLDLVLFFLTILPHIYLPPSSFPLLTIFPTSPLPLPQSEWRIWVRRSRWRWNRMPRLLRWEWLSTMTPNISTKRPIWTYTRFFTTSTPPFTPNQPPARKNDVMVGVMDLKTTRA